MAVLRGWTLTANGHKGTFWGYGNILPCGNRSYIVCAFVSAE